MGDPPPAGARVVVLDGALAALPIAPADIGLPWNWRIGPAVIPVGDEIWVTEEFTPMGVGLRAFSRVHVEQPWSNSPGRTALAARALESLADLALFGGANALAIESAPGVFAGRDRV